MKKKRKQSVDMPTVGQVEDERRKNDYRTRYRKTLISTISVLTVVAAVAVLVSTLFLPVIQVSGNSMNPTLADGDILVLVNSKGFERGDLCCVSWGNKKLLKRIIGLPGDTVVIDEDGNVYVNNELLDEPYIDEKNYGDCDVQFPCIVPDDTIFMLGDHRVSSVDSRNSQIGCVSQEQIVGHVVMRVWPFDKGFGFM